MSEPLYHFYKRKKNYKKSGSHSNHESRLHLVMDRWIYVIGAFGPIMTIPQLFKIWIEKDATGVSLISWASYLIVAIFWVIYGIMHKEKPIIFTMSSWIIIEALIVIGLVMYG